MKPFQNGTQESAGFLKYTGMAFQMILIIVVCTFLGFYVDKNLPWKTSFATIFGMLLGVASSLYVILKKI
ncbi:MAG: AtpZ/AtpI family protein [Flavobacteriaceae bacterium]|nr:AtpZ/AtpI family protein [Flavobacteriaceae bacterium]